jgi:hypothetical protein
MLLYPEDTLPSSQRPAMLLYPEDTLPSS